MASDGIGMGTAGTLAERPARKPWGLGAPPARMLDRVEQAIVLVLFALLCWRLWPESLASAHWYGLMLLLSEGTVLAFVLIRRPTAAITRRPVEWAVGFGGTLASLLVVADVAPFLPKLGFSLILAGWIVHLAAKLTLRRSFGIVAANRGVKTSGIYALVRHPMYLGYLVSHVGFLLSAPSLWNLGVYAVAWTCLAARMKAEEGVMMAEPSYRAYMARVRYRLIPLIW